MDFLKQRAGLEGGRQQKPYRLSAGPDRQSRFVAHADDLEFITEQVPEKPLW